MVFSDKTGGNRPKPKHQDFFLNFLSFFYNEGDGAPKGIACL